MKQKIFILITGVFFLYLPAIGQDESQKRQLSAILKEYFGIRDGLVKGDAAESAARAAKFAEQLNTIDYKLISEGNLNVLLKDATIISKQSEIKNQRQAFAGLSENIILLVESLRFPDSPLYKVYCPMLKLNWLSTEKTIRNPYYGKAMLECGEIVKTY